MSWRSGRATKLALKIAGSRPASDKPAAHLGTRKPTLLDGGWPAASMQRPAYTAPIQRGVGRQQQLLMTR